MGRRHDRSRVMHRVNRPQTPDLVQPAVQPIEREIGGQPQDQGGEKRRQSAFAFCGRPEQSGHDYGRSCGQGYATGKTEIDYEE